MGILFILLTIVPFVELTLLFKVGRWLGTANTLGLIVLSGALGAYFLKQQGRQIFHQAQSQISAGKEPTALLLKGLLTFVGGVLMLTPGFLTDALGLSFVFPLTQMIWLTFVKRVVKKGMAAGHIHVVGSGGFGSKPTSSGGGTGQGVGMRGAQQGNSGSHHGVDVIDVTAKKSSSQRTS